MYSHLAQHFENLLFHHLDFSYITQIQRDLCSESKNIYSNRAVGFYISLPVLVHCTAAQCLLAPVAQDSWFTRATASYEKQNNALSLTLFANRQLGKSSTLSEFIRRYWLPHFGIPLFTPFCAGLNNTRHWNSTSNFIITPVPCSVKSFVVCQVFPWSANTVALVVITIICGFHVLQTLTERELAPNIFFY